MQTDAQYFANLASAGVTIFASSGDGGSTPGPSGGEDASGPLQVELPSSDVNVTGVGGTSLTLNSNGSESSEVAWSYSGGGISEYFTRPSWQTGTGVPTGTMRAVPDVACPADPNNGAVLYYNGAQAIVGGTSWSSPTWAGYCALINQARSNASLSQIGLLGPQIYPLIGSTNFRDISSGSNSVGANSGGKYSAGIGYDPVTGIGVPLMQTLTQTLVGSSQLLGVQIQPVFQSIVSRHRETRGFSAVDTRIVIGNRHLADSNGKGPAALLALNTRSVGWLPTALTVALTVSTPVPWRRRCWALLWGLLLIHAFILFSVFVYIWNESTTVSLVTLSPFWKEIADALEYTLVTQMGISFSIPVLIWITVLFRRQDVKIFVLTQPREDAKPIPKEEKC